MRFLLSMLALLLIGLAGCDQLGSESSKEESGAGSSALASVPALPAVPPPPDQEISVNLVFAGMSPAAQSKALDFDFKMLWGDYKHESEQLTVPISQKQGRANLDLGEARLQVMPQIVGQAKGKYEVQVSDADGKLIGIFDINETGKPVELRQDGSAYQSRLVYYHPEKRLSGFTVYKAGTHKEQLGLIFVGRGWEFVESSKKADLSKGYLFPEVDLVVLPKAWIETNDMSSSCDTLKAGTATGGGLCYS